MGQRGQYSGEVFGEVRLQDLIARGGMGEIYRGHHEVLDIGVAIKVILPNQGTDSEFKERFLREARASLQLTHPNILRVFTAAKKESVYYIIMEYIDGTDVKQILKMHKRIDWRYSVNIVKQTCDGLSYAHKQGVIHRDIKPDNIMLTRKGLVKIADFGLATMKSAQSSLTTTGQVLGTPLFMSPEQCKGVKADNRADIYSLGITWYNMLVGRPPFVGESPAAVIGQHLQRAPHYPDAIFKKVPNKLKAILETMLAKDRESRYQDLDEVLQQISHLSQEFTKKIGQNDVKQVVQELQFKKNKRPISSAEIPSIDKERLEKHAQEAAESFANGMDVSELDADDLLKEETNSNKIKSNSEVRIQTLSPELAKTKPTNKVKKRPSSSVKFNKFPEDTKEDKLDLKPKQQSKPQGRLETGTIQREVVGSKNLTPSVASGKFLTMMIFFGILLLAAGGVFLLPKILDFKGIGKDPEVNQPKNPDSWILCTAKNVRDEVSIFKISRDGSETIQISKSFEDKLSPVYNTEMDAIVYLENAEEGVNLVQDFKGKKRILVKSSEEFAPKSDTQLFWCSEAKRLYYIDNNAKLIVLEITEENVDWKQIQFLFNEKPVHMQDFTIWRQNKVAFITHNPGTDEKRTLWFADIFDSTSRDLYSSKHIARRLKLQDRIYVSSDTLLYPFLNPAGTRISFLESNEKNDEINTLNLLGKEKESLFKSDKIRVKGSIVWFEYKNKLMFIGQEVKADKSLMKRRLYLLDRRGVDSKPESMISNEFEVTSFSLMECK